MRNLITAYAAAAFILIPAQAYAAGKPSTNVRMLLPAVKFQGQRNTNIRMLLPAVRVAAKPKTKGTKQQYMVIKLENVMITSY